MVLNPVGSLYMAEDRNMKVSVALPDGRLEYYDDITDTLLKDGHLMLFVKGGLLKMYAPGVWRALTRHMLP